MRDTDIAACFNRCFGHSRQVRMIGGALEPLYLPAAEGRLAELYYREDFAASALHEAAHWCIAGHRRRLQMDFGYHYEAPPRSKAGQQRFFSLEIRAQALESIFTRAAGLEFRPSADNLEADLTVFSAALENARHDMKHWLHNSKDTRALQFCDALAAAR